MTQRIFDVNNEQDVKDLFGLLPDDCIRIDIDTSNAMRDGRAVFKIYSSSRRINLIKINWQDKTEIKRPVDYSEYIGKLGRFDNSIVGLFSNIADNGAIYMIGNSDNFSTFIPLTLEEIKEKGLV